MGCACVDGACGSCRTPSWRQVRPIIRIKRNYLFSCEKCDYNPEPSLLAAPRIHRTILYNLSCLGKKLLVPVNMLIDVASLIYSNVATANPSPSITIALICLLMYAWRLWNFTLSPLLDNKKPEQIPYWIPCKLKKKLLPVSG